MFLTTVLPANAQIVTRGGPGQEAWGHPLEPTAQYNHVERGAAEAADLPLAHRGGRPDSRPAHLVPARLRNRREGDRQPAKVTVRRARRRGHRRALAGAVQRHRPVGRHNRRPQSRHRHPDGTAVFGFREAGNGRTRCGGQTLSPVRQPTGCDGEARAQRNRARAS